MRFVVTGTPRSATKYAARLFTALGVQCHHEGTIRPFTPVVDLLRWYARNHSGESSWMAWTVLPLFPGPLPVFHTIRDPWAVIDSLANRNSILRDTEGFMSEQRDTIAAYCPRVCQQTTRVDRAAAMVIDWNKAIRRAVGKDVFTYRADRLNVLTVGRMLAHIGIERTRGEIINALAEVSTQTNAGYTIGGATGISDPVVEKAVLEYAEQMGVETVWVRQVQNEADRQTPEELAAEMSPELLNEVNQYAAANGYDVVPATVAA